MTRALFFVGPEKTGTTAIWQALKSVDAPLPLKRKETFFFDRYYIANRVTYLDRNFKRDDNLVEVSPSYFGVNDVPCRICEMFPHAQAIITLREPVARTISMYRHLLRYGWIRDVSLLEAIDSAVQLMPGSLYRQGCARWIYHLGPDNVLILRQNPSGTFSNAIFPAIAAFSSIATLARATFSGQSHNKAMVARSRILARLSNKLNYILKNNHLAGVVDIGKKLGIHRMLYSNDISRLPAVPEVEISAVNQILAEDSAFFYSLRQEVTTGVELAQLLNAPPGLPPSGFGSGCTSLRAPDREPTPP